MSDPSLLSPANTAVATAIVVLIVALRQLWPEAFATRFGKRLLPPLPVVLGVLASVMGLTDAGSLPITTWPSRIVVGLLTGAAASSLYQIAAKTVLAGTMATPPPKTDPGEREPTVGES